MASTTFEFSANINNCTVVPQVPSNINMNSANLTTAANKCEFNIAQASKDIVAKFNSMVSV